MQQTDAQLTAEANVIGNETTAGANTADRVRDHLINLIDSKGNNFTTFRKTAAQWTSDNTVLGDGVKGEETDTGKFKVGPGAWNSLSYAGGSAGHTIEDEGTPLTARTKLNFVGTSVAVTDDPGNDATVVTISAGSGDDKADALITTSTKTANYTLAAGDLTSVNAGEQLVFLMNVATANDFTIPPNSSVAFPTGTVIKGVQYGAGQVTIVPDSGVTMRSPFNANKTYAQYSEFYIEKIGSDEWILGGDITA